VCSFLLPLFLTRAEVSSGGGVLADLVGPAEIAIFLASSNGSTRQSNISLWPPCSDDKDPIQWPPKFYYRCPRNIGAVTTSHEVCTNLERTARPARHSLHQSVLACGQCPSVKFLRPSLLGRSAVARLRRYRRSSAAQRQRRRRLPLLTCGVSHISGAKCSYGTAEGPLDSSSAR
jgi:hypothetical protein